MSVFYKKIQRKSPLLKDQPGKFYPYLVTLGQSVDLYHMAYLMQKDSALSLGQIQNVLNSFVDAMRVALYNGQTVNIRDFGIFRLVATTTGADKKEECTVDKICSVRINFRASSRIRPHLGATTRTPGEVITFIDLEEKMAKDGEPNPAPNPEPEPVVPVEPAVPVEP